MVFNRTDDSHNPGVGDYKIDNPKFLKKSPKATIGNAVRFTKNKLKAYIPYVPHQYIG